MSVTINTYASSLKVWVANCSHIYNVFAYAFFEELPNGNFRRLLPSSEEVVLSHFSQGKENICGNNSVTHTKLSGEISFFPFSNGKSCISRSVSYEPSYWTQTEFRMEYIGTRTTGCQGSSHYRTYRRGDFFNPAVNRVWDAIWSLNTYSYTETRFQGDTDGPGEKKRYYRVDFPSDLTNASLTRYSDGSRTVENLARAFELNESGATIAQTYTRLILNPLGFIQTPSTREIVKSLPIPSAGGAVVPDDLLVRLSKKIGSLKVNNLANIAQLRKLQEFLPPAIKKSGKVFKTLSEFFLWYKYSIKTTEGDLGASMEYFLRQEDSGSLGSKGYAHRAIISNSPEAGVTDRFIFYLGSYQQSILDKFGLNLTLENTWDLIPFSFVVDWFTKIGDMLASLDAVDEWAHVPVICFSQSRKAYRPYQLPDELKQATGAIRSEFYCRTVSRELPVVAVAPDLNMPRGCLLTAVSLIIANKR